MAQVAGAQLDESLRWGYPDNPSNRDLMPPLISSSLTLAIIAAMLALGSLA
jgi:hypothetical protein